VNKERKREKRKKDATMSANNSLTHTYIIFAFLHMGNGMISVTMVGFLVGFLNGVNIWEEVTERIGCNEWLEGTMKDLIPPRICN
jgi:hypothetical protein